MTCKIAYQANARITRHGLNVFPLQGFGILLGESAPGGSDVEVSAALPVGNTAHWHSAEGRFSHVEEALAAATDLFPDPHMHPVGLYCTVYWNVEADDGGDTDIKHVLATAPRLPTLSWLLLRAVDGGDADIRPVLWHLGSKGWSEVEWVTVRKRPAAPASNPRRLNTAWNRAWGVLDYSNHHETELSRIAAHASAGAPHTS